MYASMGVCMYAIRLWLGLDRHGVVACVGLGWLCAGDGVPQQVHGVDAGTGQHRGPRAGELHTDSLGSRCRIDQRKGFQRVWVAQ